MAEKCFEYTFISGDTVPHALEYANELGKRGWELVGLYNNPEITREATREDFWFAVYKKEVQPT